jgi:hypothetical protein
MRANRHRLIVDFSKSGRRESDRTGRFAGHFVRLVANVMHGALTFGRYGLYFSVRSVIDATQQWVPSTESTGVDTVSVSPMPRG